jgi:hypothetical protein
MINMKNIWIILCLLFAGVAQAQDLFQESLYSAELVMKNREKIALTDEQAEKIKKIHSINAGDFNTLKWDLDAATEKLKTMLNEPKPNQQAVQKQMDLVLSLENSLKKKQLTTLVAIKNELSETQQAELKAMKETRVRGTAFSSSGSSGTSNFTYVQGKPLAVSVAGTANQPKPIIYLNNKDGKLTKIEDMESINPDQISSVEVLKDKMAIDRVGIEGKNGIVIITLK